MRSFIRTQLWPAVAILLAFTVITGLAYPAAVTAIAQVAFPSQANGSMIVVDGQTIGSSLIGQAFDDPKYFSGRPSAAGSRLRRNPFGRIESRPLAGADRPHHGPGGFAAQGERQRADPRGPGHDLRLRP